MAIYQWKIKNIYVGWIPGTAPKIAFLKPLSITIGIIGRSQQLLLGECWNNSSIIMLQVQSRKQCSEHLLFLSIYACPSLTTQQLTGTWDSIPAGFHRLTLLSVASQLQHWEPSPNWASSFNISSQIHGSPSYFYLLPLLLIFKNVLRWEWLIKWHRFQMHNFIIHHLFTTQIKSPSVTICPHFMFF